jgi:diacylglycerol O-acyltransferase
MAETRRLERLTASDLFLLLWDDYGWSGDIGGLAILDGTSLLDRDGRVRIEAVRRQLEPRLHLVPRFRQRLYRPRRGLGWPLWVDAPAFDLADHIRVHPLAAPGDQAQLLQACQELARRRLDPSRPLWELWLLPGLPERRVGAFLKLHHAFADGAAGVAAFGALLDLTADAPTPAAPPWTPTPIPTAGELLGDNLRRRGQGLGRTLLGLAHPGRTLRRARGALPAWREFFAEQRAPRTSLNRPIGADRRLAIVRGRLDLTKQIAHAHHAKVNDVVLAAVAGGLRQLLARRGEDAQGLVLRAMVPISLHQEQPGQAQGNQDGWMIVPLPLGESDPVRRLQLIAAQTQDPSADRQRDLRIAPVPTRVPARLRPPAAHEHQHHQRPRSAGAAVSCRSAAAGAVPGGVAHGQPHPCCPRTLLRRAAQPHRGRRPGHLPGRGGVRPGRAQRPRRPRAIGACAYLLSRARDPARGQSKHFGLRAPGASMARSRRRSHRRTRRPAGQRRSRRVRRSPAPSCLSDCTSPSSLHSTLYPPTNGPALDGHRRWVVGVANEPAMVRQAR